MRFKITYITMHVYLEVYDLMWVFNKLFSNKKFNLIDILKRF